VVEFRILGPFEAVQDGRKLALGGRKQRALLAYLLLRRGEAVTSERLIDELWGERPPPSAAKSVHVYVSRLRKILPERMVVTRAGGYALERDDADVDLDTFERLR
jgi:DNA-binding SARP family transcriptional activator